MRVDFKVKNHQHAISLLADYLGEKRYLLMRHELSLSKTTKGCLRYAHICGALAGFSGHALTHAIVREASAHKAITQQATNLFLEGIAKPEASAEAKTLQMQADNLVKRLLSVEPLFQK